jgi:hypothetical protein
VARGRITVHSYALGAGDALKADGGTLRFEGGQRAEVLVFDLPEE